MARTHGWTGLIVGPPGPTMLAAAVGGVMQAAQTPWFFQSGDLATAISDGLAVLERGIGADPKAWSES